jgi:hypothetical protein
MRWAHPDIIDICLALAPFDLPPYVLLEIIDWLPQFEKVSHHKKIHLIQSVWNSIRKINMMTFINKHQRHVLMFINKR